MGLSTNETSHAIVEACAGAVGGCIATIATYPLMTAAARQASGVSGRSLTREGCKYPDKETGKSPEGCGLCKESGENGEEEHDEKEMVRTPTRDAYQSGQASVVECYQHIQTMYNGLGASLIGTSVSQGVYFYFYSSLKSFAMRRRQMKNRVGTDGMDQGVAESLSIASLAGMANVLLTNPIWIVATRMQTYRNHETVQDDTKAEGLEKMAAVESWKAPSTLSTIASIYHEYGIQGFWNGVRASLIMVINPTIQYAIYEWLMAARFAKKKRPSSLQVFLMSAVAKAGATIMTYPMLTVKTRLMSARKHDTDLQYSGVFDAVSQIMRREGLGGYYRGMSTKITQSILGAAILLNVDLRVASMMSSIFRSISFMKRRNLSNSSLKKKSKARLSPQPRNGGCSSAFQWLIGCWRPRLVEDIDFDEDQQSGPKHVSHTVRDFDVCNEDDRSFSKETEFIQVALYTHGHSPAVDPVRVSPTEVGLHTAVSIEPSCVNHDLKSGFIFDPILSAFPEKGSARDGQHQELCTEDGQGLVIALNSSQDTTSIQNIFIHQTISTEFQEKGQKGTLHLKSNRRSQINGTGSSGETIADATSVKDLHAKTVTRHNEKESFDSYTMQRLIEQKQHLTNELWHVSAALQYPGSGVGSSGGYQVEKDPRYQSILCDSIDSLQERKRFISESHALLTLLDQEIKDFEFHP